MKRCGVLILSLAFSLMAPAARAEPGLLTLERAYDLALASDQAIQIAYWEVRKANLLPWSALTRLGPQISASTGYMRAATSTARTVTVASPLSSASTSARQSVLQTSTVNNGAASSNLALTQPLIDLTVFPAFRLGKLSAQAARLAHQFTIRATLFGVTTAYYEVLKQQKLVEVNRQTLALGNQQLDLAQKRAAVGEVTRTDVSRAQVSVEASRRTFIESDNTLELDRNTLRNILNLPMNEHLELAEPPDYPVNLPPFAMLWERARTQREDLRQKELAVAQDVERKNEILASYAPRVVAEGRTGLANNTGSSRSRTNNWSVDVAVDWPIFTGGQREIDLATAKFQMRESALARDQVAKQVEADVKQAWLTVRTLEGTLRALRVQVTSAEQAYHDLQIQYQSGTATSVDVLSGLNDLNISRRDLAVQTYDFQVALRNIEQVTGFFQEKRVQQVKKR